MLLIMPIAGMVTGRFQPKYLMAMGLTGIALSMWYSTSLTPDASFDYFAWVRVYQMIGLPFLFIPINTVAYDGLPADKTNQASALMNVARNLGGSIGISLANVVLTQRTQFHQSRLVENTDAVLAGLSVHPAADDQVFHRSTAPPPAKRTARRSGIIGQMIGRQATILAYIDVFHVCAIVAALMIPLVLFLVRRVQIQAARGGGTLSMPSIHVLSNAGRHAAEFIRQHWSMRDVHACANRDGVHGSDVRQILSADACSAICFGAAAPEPVTVNVVMIDYKFVPDHLTFQHDVHYRLHLENHGKETHEFTAPTFFATAKIDNPDVLNREHTEIVMQPGDVQGSFPHARQARHLRSALRRPRLERHGGRHHRPIDRKPARPEPPPRRLLPQASCRKMCLVRLGRRFGCRLDAATASRSMAPQAKPARRQERPITAAQASRGGRPAPQCRCRGQTTAPILLEIVVRGGWGLSSARPGKKGVANV